MGVAGLTFLKEMKLTVVHSVLLMLLSFLGSLFSVETKCSVLLKGLKILYSISRDIIFCSVLPIVSLCIYTSHTHFNF